jgi:hypothetical protein
MSDTTHWQTVYETKRSDEVSWYRPHLDRSLALVDGLALGKDARILDAGAGASTLVDDLLARGFEHLTLLDLSAAALEVTRARLGARASQVTFLVGDAAEPLVADASIDLWHDRAVFHFQTDPARRSTYVERIARAGRSRDPRDLRARRPRALQQPARRALRRRRPARRARPALRARARRARGAHDAQGRHAVVHVPRRTPRLNEDDGPRTRPTLD